MKSGIPPVNKAKSPFKFTGIGDDIPNSLSSTDNTETLRFGRSEDTPDNMLEASNKDADVCEGFEFDSEFDILNITSKQRS